MLGTINDVSMEQQYQVNYESEVYGMSLIIYSFVFGG